MPLRKTTTEVIAQVGRHKLLSALAVAVIKLVAGSAMGGGARTGQGEQAGNNTSGGTIPADNEPAAPPITPKTYTGTGDDVVTLDKPTNSTAILRFECPNCTGNTVVQTNGADTLIVNTIGAYSGSHIIDTAVGSNTTQVTITATADWTLSLSDLGQATQVNGQPVSGQGDSVLYLGGKTTTAAFTNTGDDNFVVEAYPANGGNVDLAINTIGSYSGTVPISAPAYVQIESNGSWSLTPR